MHTKISVWRAAEDEANKMTDSLVTAGCETQKIEWKSALDLRHRIDELPSQGISLLVISIMTHGKAGMLYGCNGSHIPITDVLQIVDNKLSEQVPMVCIHSSILHGSKHADDRKNGSICGMC